MSTRCHRRDRKTALTGLAATAGLGLAALLLAAPAAAQNETSNPQGNPNVLIDYSVLDDLADGAAGDGGEILPAPANKPISRMLISSDGSPVPELEPSQSPEETFSSVPTTPIETMELSEDEAETAAGETSDAALSAAEDAGDATSGDAATEPEESAAAEQAAETASLTPLIEGQVRIAFEPGSDEIPEPAPEPLGNLIQKLNDDPFVRVQVLAYAAGDEDSASVARRISLGRAMAVRKYLSDQGVAMDRMDVRALGNTALEEPIDRVDVIPLPQ